MDGYVELKSEEDLQKWIKCNYTEEQINHLISNINNADSPLFFYVGEGYRRINKLLRNNKEYNKSTYDIEMLQKMISSFSVSENLIVYRYVAPKEYVCLFKNTSFKKSYIYPCFCSTTLIKNLYSIERIKHRRMLIKIYIPKGTPGMYIPELVEDAPEYELLLPYGIRLKRVGFKSFIVQ